MNKIIKIILAIFGGISAVFDFGLPILVALLWVKSNSINSWSSILIVIVGICASLFKATKLGLIEFLK